MIFEVSYRKKMVATYKFILYPLWRLLEIDWYGQSII